jgi:hypothetical protein
MGFGATAAWKASACALAFSAGVGYPSASTSSAEPAQAVFTSLPLQLSGKPFLQKTARLQQIQDDIWSFIESKNLPVKKNDFNPYPSTLLSLEDEKSFPSDRFSTLPNGTIFCRTAGVMKSEFGLLSERYILVGASPTRLSIRSKAMDVSPEITAAGNILHETAHLDFSKNQKAMRFVLEGLRTKRQKIGLEESYGDIGALFALSRYYPLEEVLIYGERLSAYRERQMRYDPLHYSSDRIDAALAYMRSDQWETPATIEEALSRAVSMRDTLLVNRFRDVPKDEEDKKDSAVSACRFVKT